MAVFNPKLIPASLDVVVGDHYFELGFEVEKIGVDENGEEAVFEWSGEEAGEGKGEKGDREFFPRKEEHERERPRDTNTLVLMVDRRGRLQVQRLASMQMT